MSEKEAIIEAFTELAPRYEQVVDGELKRFWGWSYDGFIENMINMTEFMPDDVILDVATGTGVIPRKLVGRGKTSGKIIGLDITLAMLQRAEEQIKKVKKGAPIQLTCASAMGMPYRSDLFDVILCGLATHHLNVPVVLAEMQRVLKSSGRLTIADVGGSALWRFPLINGFIRVATFFYFLPKEGYARAKSEAAALDHVLTEKEWRALLENLGFEKIVIQNLPVSHFWSPTPFVIQAYKRTVEFQNG
jgi:ubiquinone/menaquinone biosynthesis C-methylase UbiE